MVVVRAGSPSSTGRRRRTISFTTVLPAIVASTVSAARRYTGRPRGCTTQPTPDSGVPEQPVLARAGQCVHRSLDAG